MYTSTKNTFVAYQDHPKQNFRTFFFHIPPFPPAHQPWGDLPAIEMDEALGKRNP